MKNLISFGGLLKPLLAIVDKILYFNETKGLKAAEILDKHATTLKKCAEAKKIELANLKALVNLLVQLGANEEEVAKFIAKNSDHFVDLAGDLERLHTYAAKGVIRTIRVVTDDGKTIPSQPLALPPRSPIDRPAEKSSSTAEGSSLHEPPRKATVLTRPPLKGRKDRDVHDP